MRHCSSTAFLRVSVLVLSLFCRIGTAGAQGGIASGIVVDQGGEPMVGVDIVERGTTNGTVSDLDGRFQLKLQNEKTVLVFSCIGFASQEVNAAAGADLKVILEEDRNLLEDVVVVGYVTARKKDLTGSVSQVRPDKFQNENLTTVQDVLRGTAGLNVGYNASAKGGGDFSIRGQRSVYTDGDHNAPLIILDNMIFYGELSEINPDDIEQIDVLKDASSAAIYGAKGANGVVVITTKKGRMGKPVVNFTANVGFSQKAKYWDRWRNQDEYLRHYQDWMESKTYGYNEATGKYEAYQSGSLASKPGYYANPSRLPSGVSLDQWRGYTTNDSGEPDLSIWAKRLGMIGGTSVLNNLLAGKWTDWENLSFRTGLQQDYNASVSGATDKVNYYMSFGYLHNQGVLIDDDYKSYRANLKLNAQIAKWLEMGVNVNFQNRSDGSCELDEDYQMRNSPYGDYKDAQGNFVQYPMAGYSQQGYNYEFERQYLDLQKGYTTFNTIFNAKVKLPFNITYSFNIAPRFQFFYDRYFMSAELPGSTPTDRGVNREQAKRFDWSLNNTITWDQIFSSRHHVNVTLVQEAEDRRYWSDRIEARDIQPSDALGIHNTQNGSKTSSSFSTNDIHQSADALLARAFYSYDDRYMITASVRRDGYSAFGAANKYALFPSVALGWTFTNEKFFNWKPLTSGKLRVSYGKNGNRSLSDPYVALANLYSGSGKTMGYVNPDGSMEQVKYLMAERLANEHLQWEKTTAYNFGLDLNFFEGRLTATIDAYIMQTKDMIMNQSLPSFTGFSSITTNLGQVDNNGVELALSAIPVKLNDFEWSTTFDFSYNRNIIRHLYYEYDSEGREMDDVDNKWFIGHDINSIWDYKVTGIWQLDEVEEAAAYGQRPGDPKVANLYAGDDIDNGDGTYTHVYNNNDRTFLGTTVAPFRWSWRNQFTYRNWDFSFRLYSLAGHKRTSTRFLNEDDDGGRMAYSMANKERKPYWTVDNPSNSFARIEAKGPTGAQTPPKVYDAGFIRMDNIALSYTVPTKLTQRAKINRVKVFASVKNPFTITFDKDWVYGDIEVDGLSIRTYSLGVNVTF
ncbi:MAG: SusC/RagA family TonB-linked outer membrane protein [Bacteroidales bacterium]|nr:SusC/RagA family TonB-linked outer membrane protein [Bacteroidales bacterium]